MTRAFYLLPELTIDRPFTLGRARVLPAGTADRELHKALTRAVSHDSARAAQQAVAALLERWSEHAVLEVPVVEDPNGRVISYAHTSVALETMAVLRFFVRRMLRVNVEAHRFGLEGETIDVLRNFILLWDNAERDTPLTAPGWSRVASRVPLHLGARWLDELAADPAFACVSDQLATASDKRTVTGRRALMALAWSDQAYTLLNPSQQALAAGIAVETMLGDGRSGPGWARIARRVAFIRCRGDCSVGAVQCPYLSVGHKPDLLNKQVDVRAATGQPWECSAYLDITAPIAARPGLRHQPIALARNNAAHEGDAHLDDKELRRLLWTAQSVIYDTIVHFNQTGDDVDALDEAIGQAVAAAGS